jgi:excisionase family DNA binding protein
MLQTLIPFYRNTVKYRKAGFIDYAIIAYMRTLFNPKEAGERLRISESTVYRLFRRHKLKGLKVGRGLRFTQEEIIAFIERHREHVEPEKQETRAISIPQTPKISFN